MSGANARTRRASALLVIASIGCNASCEDADSTWPDRAALEDADAPSEATGGDAYDGADVDDGVIDVDADDEDAADPIARDVATADETEGDTHGVDAPAVDDVVTPATPHALVPALPYRTPLAVTPVLFVPSDASPTEVELAAAADAFAQHLVLVRDFFEELLGTPSFALAAEGVRVHRSLHPNARFTSFTTGGPSDSAHLITAELLAADGEDRYSSRAVYVVVYVRPADSPWDGVHNYFGGGRPFNGTVNTGGAYIELEYASLTHDGFYGFLGTLAHELGHAFGLPHVDCYGRDQRTDSSIMSYNPSHQSIGFSLGPTPGDLHTEELFVLSLNERALPDFEYISSIPARDGVDLGIVSRCFSAPMSELIGPFVHLPGVGYELYFDQVRVSGAAAHLFSLHEAVENCTWNIAQSADRQVSCFYNGRELTP